VPFMFSMAVTGRLIELIRDKDLEQTRSLFGQYKQAFPEEFEMAEAFEMDAMAIVLVALDEHELYGRMVSNSVRGKEDPMLTNASTFVLSAGTLYQSLGRSQEDLDKFKAQLPPVLQAETQKWYDYEPPPNEEV
jgi:hypothetical protein